MLRSFYIVRVAAALLLLVFTLGITPKIFVHDLFAKHIDNPAKKSNTIPFQVNKSGYSCDRDNLVAESIFVTDQQLISFTAFISFSVYIFREASLHSIFKSYYPLRGPPVNI